MSPEASEEHRGLTRGLNAGLWIWSGVGVHVATVGEPSRAFVGLLNVMRLNEAGGPSSGGQLCSERAGQGAQFAGTLALSAKEVSMDDPRPKRKIGAGLAPPACELPPTGGQ